MVFRVYIVLGSIVYEFGNSYYFIGKVVDYLFLLKELDNKVFKKCYVIFFCKVFLWEIRLDCWDSV